MKMVSKIQSMVDSTKVAQLVKECTDILFQNGVIAVPTDTIYGICCLADSEEGVNRIYELKKRDFTKPLSICVNHYDQVYAYSHVTISHSLLEKLLPGPNTLIFKRSDKLSEKLNPLAPNIGIRMLFNDSIVSQIIKGAGTIALTSANQSSHQSPLDITDFTSIWDSLDLIVDAGRLSRHEEQREGSTIINLVEMGAFKIIRKGINYEQVITLLNNDGLVMRSS